jgi:glycerophosphoryl diester phosphodiesterase
VLIQSFSPASLRKLHTLAPDLPLVQLYYSTESSATISAQLDETRAYAVAIGPAKEDVDAALVAAAHERCLDVHPYTVDEPAEMDALIATGVDGMFTNYPGRLSQARGATPAAALDRDAARRAAETGAACRGGR